MCLAAMLSEGRDELICDFAETYHVLDIWALPVPLMATLAAGLRDNSRIKMKMSGITHIPVEMVLPKVADTLTAIACGFAGRKAQPPEWLTDVMLGKEKPKVTESKPVMSFDSGEDFDKAWAEIIGAKHGGK